MQIRKLQTNRRCTGKNYNYNRFCWKIALIKVDGELLSGKPSDINFSGLRQALYNQGALVGNINHYNLSTEEKNNPGITRGKIGRISKKRYFRIWLTHSRLILQLMVN